MRLNGIIFLNVSDIRCHCNGGGKTPKLSEISKLVADSYIFPAIYRTLKPLLQQRNYLIPPKMKPFHSLLLCCTLLTYWAAAVSLSSTNKFDILQRQRMTFEWHKNLYCVTFLLQQIRSLTHVLLEELDYFFVELRDKIMIFILWKR